MPNAPKTPLRTFRLEDDLWRDFGAATDDRSAAVRAFVEWYVRRPGARLPRRPDISRTADPITDGDTPHSGA
jgi:hypothetical protein